jgi:hypothetical protein
MYKPITAASMCACSALPLLDATESEVGKTFMCNIILRTVDPRTTELRKLRRIEDLLISAKNNWTLGFDNFSWMSKNFADTFCMIATGISSGARALLSHRQARVLMVASGAPCSSA